MTVLLWNKINTNAKWQLCRKPNREPVQNKQGISGSRSVTPRKNVALESLYYS